MKFTATQIEGVVVVEQTPHADTRGTFARTFCREEFRQRGLPDQFEQCSVSTNVRRGTLRGLHWQESPHAETKLVRCTRGAIYDVAIDLRRGSPTFRLWVAVELTEGNGRALLVPRGCAHGFQTLCDDTHVFYQIDEVYRADMARGARWNDPTFAIDWPVDDPILSERDRSYPDFAS